MSLLVHLILSLAALAGATLSAVLGMAGGILLLAVMLLFLDPAIAIPLHAVVQLGANATRVYAYLPRVQWRPVCIFIVAALPFPVLGLWLREQLDPLLLRCLLAALILYATWAPRWGAQALPAGVSFAVAGVVVGTLGVVLGAVGPLAAPFCLRRELTREQVIATQAVCQAWGHVLKLVAFGLVGFVYAGHLGLLIPMLLAALAGTYLGRHLLRRLRESHFRLAYRLVLTLLAVLLPLREVV